MVSAPPLKRYGNVESDLTDEQSNNCVSSNKTQTLINRGADAEAKTTTGNTALLLACERGHLDMTRLVADKGADLEAANSQGFR